MYIYIIWTLGRRRERHTESGPPSSLPELPVMKLKHTGSDERLYRNTTRVVNWPT